MASKLIVIVGETASGKSSLGLKVAQNFNGEIIATDSWTVRQEVNIGTAKPSEKEQELVPHHLLDVVEPCGDFTASVFKDLATEAIKDIESRGRLPIMVGGTGLYIDGVIFDFNFLPEGDREAREELNDMTAEELVELAQTEGLDTSEIDTRNKRRIIRLIETKGAIPTRQPLRPNTLLVGLQPDREELKSRITQRVERMIKSGLEEEVKTLSDRYGWECEALKGIGYIEWKEYFEGEQDFATIKQRIIKSTIDLAKRQRTWFKRNPHINWFNDPKKAHQFIASNL